jgi:hypothetical protein
VRGLKFRSISSIKAYQKESYQKVKFKSIIRRLIPIFGIGKYAGSFAGVSCFTCTWCELRNRAAVALPGIGIFVHPKDITNISLLRHEYGHILQAKKWGKFFFYRYIAKESIISARKSSRDPDFIHDHTWTEWTANRLSYYFFKRPDDWDMNSFPIHPPLIEREGTDWPAFLRIEKPVTLIRENATGHA